MPDPSSTGVRTKSSHTTSSDNTTEPRCLVIVIDGLRPEYITPEVMPNLSELAENGSVAAEHHAVYPSKTRVNAASVATGCFPGTHGIVANTMLYQQVRNDPYDTSSVKDLTSLQADATEGLLTTPSLGEILQGEGKELFVAGSGTPGSTMLLNHTGAGYGTYNARGYLSSSIPDAEVIERVGSFREKTAPNTKQNQWAFTAYKTMVLDADRDPAVSILWISDPDATMHKYGVGHPRVIQAINHVDTEIGHLLDRLASKNLLPTTDIFVLADHGFSSDIGSLNLESILESTDTSVPFRIVANNQIHLAERNVEAQNQIVRELHRAQQVGAILTAGPSSEAEGSSAGTISTGFVNVNHDRTADIIVDALWSDQPNAHGYPGSTTRPGVGGHGTLSPYEMNVNLIAAGPHIKNSIEPSRVPSAHVDLVPTLLSLLGISPPKAVDGRVLTELLLEQHDEGDLAVKTDSFTTSQHIDDRPYSTTLHFATVNGVRYPLQTDTQRKST